MKMQRFGLVAAAILSAGIVLAGTAGPAAAHRHKDGASGITRCGKKCEDYFKKHCVAGCDTLNSGHKKPPVLVPIGDGGPPRPLPTQPPKHCAKKGCEPGRIVGISQ